MTMKFNKFMLIGIILMLSGAFIAYGSNLLPGASILLDNTPPSLALISKPAPGGNYPADSAKTTISIYCVDLESNISAVQCTIDGSVYQCVFNYWTGTREVWTKDIYPPLSVGSHTFITLVTNGVDLTATYSGSFTIYAGLSGSWYINNVEILSQSQIVKSQNFMVSFKFAETAGPSSNNVTAYVKENNNKILTLTGPDSVMMTGGVWTGSYTFTAGLHTLVLEATDGSHAVTMSLVDLQLGDISGTLNFGSREAGNLMMLAGALITGFGFAKQRKVK